MKSFLTACLCLPIILGAQTVITESTRIAPIHTASQLGYSSTLPEYSDVFDGDGSIRFGSTADRFGADLSISGKTLLIGAPGHSSAFLYNQISTGTAWNYDEILHSRGLGILFGNSVSIGSTRFLIGQPDYQLGSIPPHGSAFFGERAAIEHKLFDSSSSDFFDSYHIGMEELGPPDDGNMLGKLQDESQFGSAVDHDSSTAIVGAFFQSNGSGDRVGAAYIFDIADAVTTGPSDSIFATEDAIELVPSLAEQDGSFYGSDVAISGDYAVVGWSKYQDTGNLLAGRAIVFKKNLSGGWDSHGILTPATPLDDGYFGRAVDVAGTTAAIGMPGPGVANLSDYQAGTVELFDAETGARLQTITAPSGSIRFGWSVALFDNLLVIGAPGNGVDVLPRAYLYQIGASGDYELVNQLEPSSNSFGTEFGSAVAVGSSGIAIGAQQESITDPGAGGVYLYDLSLIAATAEITITGTSATYNGMPQEPTISTDPAGINFTVTYNGSPDKPVDADLYSVEVTVTEPGYAQTTKTGVFNIQKAFQTISLAPIPILERTSPNQPIVATTSDGLREDEFIYASSDTNTVVIFNGAIDPRDEGVVTLTVSLPSNPNFFGVSPATATVVVEDPDAIESTGGKFAAESPALLGTGDLIGYRTAIRGRFAAALTGGTPSNELIFYRQANTGKFEPTQTITLNGFAESIDLDGDRLAVGFPQEDKVTVYERSGVDWLELDTLTTFPSWSQFGRAVNLSPDGQTLFVAAFNHSGDPNLLGGALVRVYAWDGSEFDLSQTLTDTKSTANTVSFGNAIDDNGEYLIIAGNTGNAGDGNLATFRLQGSGLYEQGASQATLFGTNGKLGTDLVVQGNRVYAGAPEAFVDDLGDRNFDGDPAVEDQGAIVIYEITDEFNAFGTLSRLGTYGLPGDEPGRFGLGGDIAVDATGRVITLSYVDAGSFDDSTFHILSTDGDDYAWVELPEPFGRFNQQAMSGGGEISADGNTLMIGAWKAENPNFDTGAVYFYNFPTVNPLSPGNVNIPSFLSTATAVAADGSTIALGIPGDRDAGSGAGAVLIYDIFRGTGLPVQKILPPAPQASTAFGSEVLLEGDTLFVVSTVRDRVYIYDRQADGTFAPLQTISPPASAPNGFGSGIAAESESPRKVLAVSAVASGTVCVYHFNSGTGLWEYHSDLTSGSPLTDGWGEGLAVNGDLIAVGAPTASAGEGMVSAFRFSNGVYSRSDLSTPSFLIEGSFVPASRFGETIALGPDYIAIFSARIGFSSSFVTFRDYSGSHPSGFSGGGSLVVDDTDLVTLAAFDDFVIIGAEEDSSVANSAGRIEIAERAPSGLFEVNRIHHGSYEQERLGSSVAITEGFAVGGALFKEEDNRNGFALIPLENFSPLILNWAASFGYSGFEALPGVDPDGDGLSNLMSYALGISPTPEDRALVAERVPQMGEGVFTNQPAVQFIVPTPLPSGVVYSVQISETFGQWSDLSVNSGTGWTQNNARVSAMSLSPQPLIRITVESDDEDLQKAFFRLKVEAD